MMDTENLRLFVLASEMLNITAAGRKLGMAPAVASGKLAKLERQLGIELLHRSTRKVSLSLEGEEFLPFAREIIAQEEAAFSALGHGTSEATGTLRIAASSTFAQLYVAPILPEFLARYPNINLELKLSDTQMDLIEGGFDLALRIYAIEDSALKARKLADDRRILCASPEYVSQYGAPQTPRELDGHQVLTFMNSKARKLLSRDGKSHCIFPPENASQRVICDDGTTMRAATEAGVGVSMNSLWSVHKQLTSGSLVRVLPDYEIKDGSSIWLVYPKSNVLTSKVRVFIDFLLEKIGKPPVWER